MTQLSVIVPTYNEAANVELLVTALADALKNVDYEILIVDDDSPDLTWQRASEIAQSNSRLRVIRRTTSPGLAASVIDGFNQAQGTAVACMDGDLQHDPETLVPMLAQLEKGSSLVVASRYVRNGSTDTWNPLRKLESFIATKLAQYLVGVKLHDPMSGFFMMRRADFLTVRDRLRAQGFKVLLEIVANLETGSVAEVPLRFRPRVAGVSKLTGRVAISYVAQLLRLSRTSRMPQTAKLGVAAPGVERR
jgi:dolichol-phosphate mannosyltransferase